MQAICSALLALLLFLAAFVSAQEAAAPASAEGVPAAPGGAEKSVPDESLSRRVREGKAPVAKGIARLREIAAMPESAVPKEERARLFEATCGQASPDELRELAGLLAKFPEGDDEGLYDSFGAYSSAAFAQEMAKLLRKPPKLAFPPVKEPLPDFLEEYPKELQSAWKAWRRVAAPCLALQKEAEKAETEKKIAYPENLAAVLRKLTLAPAEGVWKEFMLCRASGNISTGSDDERYHLRNRAIVLALLAEGKMKEAVAMACAHVADTYRDDWSGPRTHAAMLIDLLTAEGLEWEPIFLGSLLRPDNDPDFHVLYTDGQWSSVEAWTALGALGSARGVRLGMALIRQIKGFDAEDAMTFLVHAAGPPPRNWKPENGLDPREAQRTRVLPAKARTEVLAAISAQLSEKELKPLSDALDKVPGWLAKELRKPLAKLLKHPNHRIASAALALLADAGLADPKTPIAAAPKPVRVRLLMDGKPLSAMGVHVGTGDYFQSGIETDPEGRLVYPLDDVLDIENLDRISIFVATPDWSVPAEQSGKKSKVWPGPCLEYTVTVKDAQERVLDVNVETGEFELALKGAEGIPKEAEFKVTLIEGDRTVGTVGLARNMEAFGKAGDSVVFQRVQVGKYSATVEGPGVRAIKPIQLRITKTGTIKLVELEAARDVRGEVEGLDGSKSPIGELGMMQANFPCEFTRNGEKYELDATLGDPVIHSLPLGKYRFRLPAYSEVLAAMKAKGEAVPDLPPGQRFAPLIIEFELKQDTPPVLNLGTIKMKAEEPKAEK